MNTASDIRDLRKPDVPLDGERLAADAALDAYIEAAPRAKMPVAHFLKDAYLRLLATARAQELQWLDSLKALLRRVCEKRGQHVDGRIARKSLPAVHQFGKFLFRRYSRVALSLYSGTLLHARRLEVEDVLAQCHDCISLAAVLAEIGKKFDALHDALERRCKFDDVHAGDYTKTH